MGYYCNLCRQTITKEEYNFSKERWNIALCIVHQKSLTNKRPQKITPETLELGLELMKRGCPVEFEKWDGHKHIDIAIVEKKINIEVDGIHHNSSKKQALSDLKRAYYSFKKNYLTLRIPNSLTRDEKTIIETADYIVDFLNIR